MEQTPFEPGKIGFADNPEPRCASILLLDVSGSMQGNPLSELQAGLAVYRDELAFRSRIPPRRTAGQQFNPLLDVESRWKKRHRNFSCERATALSGFL